MRALVTGGAGFIGSHLVDHLVQRGDEVIVLDNLSRACRSRSPCSDPACSGRMLVGDIRDYETVHRAMEGVEVVFHLAGQANVMGAVQDMDNSFSSNVIGTYHVLKSAAARGVRRVVFTSSREVYGESETLPVAEIAPIRPKNAYGASKAAAEAYCQFWEANGGLQCQVLRLANIYGPGDRERVIPNWLDRAQRGADLDLYGGDQVLDFLWVGRAVQALTAASEIACTGPINVASGHGVRLIDLADYLIALTDGRSSVKRRPVRTAEVVRFVADVTKMRDLLGVEPPAEPLMCLASMVQVLDRSAG